LRDAEKLIQLASNVAGPMFRQQGRLLPMYHALGANGQHAIIPLPPDEKDAWPVIAKAAFKEIDAVAFVFISEAWIREMTPATRDEAMRLRDEWLQRGIANDPLRKEVVVFNAEDDQGGLCGHRPIIRHKGRPHLGELEVETFTESEGRMVGLLPVRGTVQ
jgi:hypothetical protein